MSGQISIHQVSGVPKERDRFIIESLQEATPMVHNMAMRSAHDADDLSQTSALAALLAYPRAQKVTNPRAYLHRTIRNAALLQVGGVSPAKRAQRLSDHYQIVSLDAPLGSHPTFTLGDTIEATVSTERSSRDFSRLYAAIAVLPAIHAQVICMRFGLCGYGVHRLCEIARLLGISQHTIGRRFRCALAILRKHTELLEHHA